MWRAKTLFLLLFMVASQSPAATVDTSALQWKLNQHCRIENRDGRKILIVHVPEHVKDPRGVFSAHTSFDLRPFENIGLVCTIRGQARDIVPAGGPYPGARLLIHYMDGRDRSDQYEAARIGHDFKWQELSFSVTPSAKSGNAELRIGLESASGYAEFDLSSLTISSGETHDKPETELTPQETKDFALLTERMRTHLIGRKAATEDRIREHLTKLRADGGFSDVDYKDQNRSAWATAGHTERTLELAHAWAKPGHPYYQSPEVASAVKRAVGYWAQNRFQNSNWWWNDMSTPQKYGEILLMTSELFPTGAERDAAIAICRQAKFMSRYTGHNRVFIANNIFKRGLLEQNPNAVNAALKAILEEITVTEGSGAWELGGIRSDGSYHQHGPQIQFGNYGNAFFSDIAFWSNMLDGTRWEFSEEQWRPIRLLAFDGYQWVLWNGRMDLLAIGRQLGPNAAVNKGRIALASFQGYAEADRNESGAYRAVTARNEDGTNTLIGNRHFWNSDYMVHRRPDWYASLRMNSVRTHPVEDGVNRDNALGRYFSDGVCLIMRTGLEYDNITACWDWTRLPGTTLPATPVYTPEESRKHNMKVSGLTPNWTLSRKSRTIGETEFTGGATDGTHGVAVFTMNLDAVKAKKAYFFDEKAVWQLGTEISSESPHMVATTVNTVLRNGKIKRGENWFHHDGIGYRGTDLELVEEEREGDWRYIDGGLKEPALIKKDIVSLIIRHGLKPRNASYQFVILPGATPDETANWNQGRILVNSGALQAVEFADGSIGAVFYEPGKIGNFETASPGVFLISGNTVRAADPTAKLKTMQLKLNGNSKSAELPSGEYAGKTVIVTFD